MMTGEIFNVTGYYKYNGHADHQEHDCFVPVQANRMFFQKKGKAPKLGSCEHDVLWELIEEYK